MICFQLVESDSMSSLRVQVALQSLYIYCYCIKMIIREIKGRKLGQNLITKELLNFWPMGTTHHVLSEKPPVTMPSYLEMVSHEHRFSKKTCLSHCRSINLS